MSMERMGWVWPAAAAVLALGGSSCTAASREIQPTVPITVETESSGTTFDLSGVFTPGTVGEEPLPVIDEGLVCQQEGTTRDGVSGAYRLDGSAAQVLFDRTGAVTQVDKNSSEAPLYKGKNSRGDEVWIQTGYVDGEPQIGYIDVFDGVNHAQVFVYNEANPPGGSKDPTCAAARTSVQEGRWVIATEGVEGDSIGGQLEALVDRVGTASSFTQQ